MTARAAAIARGETHPSCVWLLEHPALYTAGTSARPQELIDARFPVYATGRGGQFTYHGPGQRVGYVMLDLKRRAPDVRRFVATIEEWIIRTLADLRRARRAPRRPHRRLGAAAGQGRRRRGQDRRHRHSRTALGDVCTAFRSTSRRTCRISPASCRAAFPSRVTASRRSPISACERRCRMSIMCCGREFEPLFGATADAQKLRQHGEQFAGTAQRQICRAGLALIDRFHARAGRAVRGTARSSSGRLLPRRRTPPRPNRRGSCAPSPRRPVRARSLRPRRGSRRPAPGRGQRPGRSRPSEFPDAARTGAARTLRQPVPQGSNVRWRQLPLQRRRDHKLHIAGLWRPGRRGRAI